jgi:hypothetical protein
MQPDLHSCLDLNLVVTQNVSCNDEQITVWKGKIVIYFENRSRTHPTKSEV